MKVRIGNGLLLLNLVGFGLIAIILFSPSNALRIILGLPFLLFFPGYALVTALFPRRERINGTERVILSLALSIVVLPVLGIILNYSPLGIRLEPILYSTTSFILICSIAGWLRRARLTQQERFSIEFRLGAPGWGGGVLHRVLYIILALAVLGTLGTVGYIIAKPRVGETFTEFYILGPEGKAIDYPLQLKVGEEETLILGIINREHETVSYWIEIKSEGVISSELGPIVLEHNEQFEQPATLTPDKPGENQKVEFLLYKNGKNEPYLEPLHLWIDVKD